MGKTRIEWLRDSATGKQGYSINPVKGLCSDACKDNQGKEYCYARRLYNRFKWNPEIRFDRKVLLAVADIKKPSRIFVGSMIELFGEWIEPYCLDETIDICRAFPQHTFIFLTKCPQNLIKWSPFPENCWVGVTITKQRDFLSSIKFLCDIKVSVRFISFEPLLWWDGYFYLKTLSETLHNHKINWVIIGQVTPIRKATTPNIEWINEICMAANDANIPVFLKNNLRPLFDDCAKKSGVGYQLRQEFPDAH